MSLPTKNIYWTEIPAGAKVELVGHCYIVDGEAVAFWDGARAREAQKLLDSLVDPAKAAKREREAVTDDIIGWHEQITERAAEYLHKVATRWKQRYPKRTVKFFDAMGLTYFEVDGEKITGDEFKALDPRQQAIFQPLEDAWEWYEEMWDQFKVEVEEFTI